MDCPHTLVIPQYIGWLRSVGVGVSLLFDRGIDPLFIPPSMTLFELEHGKEIERYRHNAQCLETVRRTRRPVLEEHAGFYDLFVPVGPEPDAILVTGPFAVARSGVADIQERWRWLTGHHGTLGDAEFAHYVEMTLQTPVLEGNLLGTFESFLLCFGRMIAGEGDALALRDQGERLRDELEAVTRVARTWEIAAGMVDGRTARSWSSQLRTAELGGVGIRELPDHLVVGLAVARPASPVDPVEELVRRCEFQRACAELAGSVDSLVFGRLGDHGIVLLAPCPGSAARRKRKLLALAESAIALADKRFQLELHVGVGPVSSSAPYNFQFASALAAAEMALSHGVAIAHAEPSSASIAMPLGEMRRQLAALVEKQPKEAASRFDHYLESVAIQCAYGMEPVRAHAEAGFDRLVEALLSAGALEPKSFADMMSEVAAASRDAATIADLFAVYRHAVTQLAEAVLHPVQGRRDRRLQRAVAFIHEHCTDGDLTLAKVARVAGYAPSHFRAVFERAEKTTFTQCVLRLKIERAKQLLTATDLTVDRVGQLSGFRERHYFHRAFKRVVGMPPLAYRGRYRDHIA